MKVPDCETVMSMAPFGVVQEVFGVGTEDSENGALLSATIAELVEVQPFAPVTVTVYVPAAMFAKSSVEALFDHK